MCCNSECLEQISPACIIPVEGIIGDNLSEQVLTIYNNLLNVQNNTITVNLKGLYTFCEPYQYNYTITQLDASNILLSFDWTVFNTPLSYVSNITILNNGVPYGNFTNNITLPATMLSDTTTVMIQFNTTTDSGISNYTDMFILNLGLNTNITRSLTCFNNQIVTLPIQTIIQMLIDRLVTGG